MGELRQINVPEGRRISQGGQDLDDLRSGIRNQVGSHVIGPATFLKFASARGKEVQAFELQTDNASSDQKQLDRAVDNMIENRTQDQPTQATNMRNQAAPEEEKRLEPTRERADGS